jgi:signal transduction histidine kinase
MFKLLRLTLWAVPIAMALVGTGFTYLEHHRHGHDIFSSWMIPLSLIILGVVGPGLAWVALFWAIRTAEAYLVSEEQLARRNEQLAALNKIALSAGSSLELGKILDEALERTIESMGASAGMIFLQGENGKGLRLQAHRGISPEMADREAHLSPGHCLCGEAVKNREVLLTPDTGLDIRCTSDLCLCEGFRSIVTSPLEVKGQLVGLLQLASPHIGQFTNGQRDFMNAISRQVSSSIENARLYDTVRAFNVELEKKVNLRTSELEAARWALAEKARQLQRLLSESYRIQEDTQSRIAHDMHDGVTQMVIGALYETQAGREAIRSDPDRAAENLARAQKLLSEVEVEIRRVIYDLHPPVLDQMGLAVALKRFAVNYQASFKIACQVAVSGESRRLKRQTEIAVYRIIQAALHNVVTHAHASQVMVKFDFGDAFIKVVVEDDGCGFDPISALKKPGEHLGLIGMRERAESLGANLVVQSQPVRGTRIELVLPSSAY